MREQGPGLGVAGVGGEGFREERGGLVAGVADGFGGAVGVVGVGGAGEGLQKAVDG
ncbi:hypothetical protein AB0D13_39995 [Streptomyces sp. NPDC048430]|uniref:hypothetical protein n=1 Tax=Streptomyces sp. NPDC048430 TaxID=3155388 RepID=UPI0034414F7B